VIVVVCLGCIVFKVVSHNCCAS